MKLKYVKDKECMIKEYQNILRQANASEERNLIKGRNSEAKKYVEFINGLLKNGKWVQLAQEERNKDKSRGKQPS